MEYKKTAKSLVGRATISSNKNKTLVKKKKKERHGGLAKSVFMICLVTFSVLENK